MTRLDTIDFRQRPFQGILARAADQSYQGYFHYHQGIEFLYVHQGQGSVILGQQVYRIEPGSLFVFQPYQLHHVQAQPKEDDPYIRTVLQFDPIAFQPYIKPYKSLEPLFHFIWKNTLPAPVFPQLQLRHPVEAILQYANKRFGGRPEQDQDGYAALLIQILQFLQAEAALPQDPGPSRRLPHTEAILQWIEEHFAEPFELDRLASELHLSKYHVSHLFKKETGRTVTDYCMARRVKEACRLLSDSSLPVAEIGAKVGWPIPSHFTQQFKRWVGCTPLQYRKGFGRKG